MTESKYTELFRFEADGMPEDTFRVLGFKGTELCLASSASK